MPECILCGAPGGYPYCNEACREAAPGPEVPVYDPDTFTPLPEADDPWATDARDYL